MRGKSYRLYFEGERRDGVDERNAMVQAFLVSKEMIDVVRDVVDRRRN